MDLSVYISELLNEHGTIGIPQIGVFKQVRKRGYYNADEGKLYPPYFETEFEQQAVTDETLLKHLIEKSKVSPASAKYFVDRYVQNIIQQAEIGEAMIGSLGWLSKEVDTITFRPATSVNVASAAFGFSPISVSNDVLAQPASAEQVAPAVETQTTPQPENAAPATDAQVVSPVNNSNRAEVPNPPQPEPVASKTFSIEMELDVTPPVEQVTEPSIESQPEQPTSAEPVASIKYSIEKELTDAPATAPKEESVAAQPEHSSLTAKAPISPLVRQHKPADKPKPVAAPVTEAAELPKPVVSANTEPVTTEPEAPARPFYLRLPFYLGVIFVIAAAAVILLLKNTANDKEGAANTDKSSKALTPSTDSVVVKQPASAPADTVVIKAPAATDTTIRNTALPESTEFAPEVEAPLAAATHPVVNSNNYKFVLVGGSYGTYEQALAASNRYKAVGISASPFENSRKLFKVALGFYKTYAEGQEVKKGLVKQGKVLTWKLYVETLRKK